MPRVFMPEELRSKLTFSSQTILFHIISTLPQLSDDSELPFNECQELELHYKHFVDNNILSKNKFYEGLKHLIELEILYPADHLPKNYYVCNPYYIDNMNKQQRHEMNLHVRALRSQSVVNNAMPSPPLL